MDIQWDILYNDVLQILDKLIPIRRFIFHKSKPEWMVGDLIEYMKDRDAALRKATRTKDRTDKDIARKARNKVNTIIRNAKNDFIKGKLNNYSDNPKSFWEQIKAVMPTSNITNPVVLENDLGQNFNNKGGCQLG